jgi:hypothetical protein
MSAIMSGPEAIAFHGDVFFHGVIQLFVRQILPEFHPWS